MSLIDKANEILRKHEPAYKGPLNPLDRAVLVELALRLAESDTDESLEFEVSPYVAQLLGIGQTNLKAYGQGLKDGIARASKPSLN